MDFHIPQYSIWLCSPENLVIQDKFQRSPRNCCNIASLFHLPSLLPCTPSCLHQHIPTFISQSWHSSFFYPYSCASHLQSIMCIGASLDPNSSGYAILTHRFMSLSIVTITVSWQPVLITSFSHRKFHGNSKNHTKAYSCNINGLAFTHIA